MTSSFARSTTSSIVELLAENGEQRFLIHRDILTAQSKPFQDAITGVWKEATQQKINLGDWDGGTVSRLVEFVYTGNYSYPDPEPILKEEIPLAADSDFNGQEPTSQETGMPCRKPELKTDRPLTPLNECIQSSLPPLPELKTDAARLEGFNQTEHDYKEVLLSHARVYVLAHYKSIERLRVLALSRVLLTLSSINPVQPDSHIPSNISHFARYIYGNTDSLTCSEEPLRKVVSQFVALNFLVLQTDEEFMNLMREGDDFISDVMPKFCRGLRYDELRLRTEARFVSNIRVEHGNSPSDRPTHLIHVFGSPNNSICESTDNGYVWLVPEYTVLSRAACTSFRYQVSNKVDISKNDISGGRCAVFRYIDPVKEQDVAQKITMVALLRSKNKVSDSSSCGYGAFNGMTSDMNDGNWNKTGEWLYILWKSVKIS